MLGKWNVIVFIVLVSLVSVFCIVLMFEGVMFMMRKIVLEVSGVLVVCVGLLIIVFIVIFFLWLRVLVF